MLLLFQLYTSFQTFRAVRQLHELAAREAELEQLNHEELQIMQLLHKLEQDSDDSDDSDGIGHDIYDDEDSFDEDAEMLFLEKAKLRQEQQLAMVHSKHLMKFWCCIGVLRLYEGLIESWISWIPGYSTVKTVLISTYLLFAGPGNVEIVYRSSVEPQLARFDLFMKQARRMFLNLCADKLSEIQERSWARYLSKASNDELRAWERYLTNMLLLLDEKGHAKD